MNQIFDLELARAVIRISVPLIFAGLGGLLSFNAGVLNIAMDGFMLVAAFAAIWMANLTGSLILGILAAMVAGVALATLFGYFNLRFKANIFIAGIAINLLASALTALLLVGIYNQQGSFVPENIPTIPTISLPIIGGIPGVGAIVDGHDPLTYLAYLAVPITAFILFRTRWGLHVRAAGENPEAAEVVGVNVFWIRMQTIWLSGAFCGIAGAYLSLVYVGSFSRDMTADRGLIALAAIFFARGKPYVMLIVAVLFGASQALAIRLQLQDQLPSQLLQVIPYAITILALIVVGIRAKYFHTTVRGITFGS